VSLTISPSAAYSQGGSLGSGPSYFSIVPPQRVQGGSSCPVSRAQPDAGEPRGSPVERLNPEAKQLNYFRLLQEKR